MVRLNTEHRNEPATEGGYGGSMCLCQKCGAERAKRNHKTSLQRQIAKASNELDKLRGMLEDEGKRNDVLDMCNVLADWEVE